VASHLFHWPIAGPAEGAVILLELEERTGQAELAADEDFKRSLGRLELVAFALEPASTLGENLRHLGRAFAKFEAELFRLHDDVCLPGHSPRW